MGAFAETGPKAVFRSRLGKFDKFVENAFFRQYGQREKERTAEAALSNQTKKLKVP
jgi:hypothetical protein